MHRKSTDTLNEILKGEQMAVQSYGEFIADCKSNEIKDVFRAIQKDHHQHSEAIAGRILELGGRPVYSTGLAGMMADAKHGLESIKERTDHEIVMEALKGEDKGVAAVEKLADGTLDEQSMKLVHDLMDKDHQHLKTLEKWVGGAKVQ